MNHPSKHRSKSGSHEGGRRSHEHGHHAGGHDAHLRHPSDRKGATHLANAVRHVETMHEGGPMGGSLSYGHYSHKGLPTPHSKVDKPGV